MLDVADFVRLSPTRRSMIECGWINAQREHQRMLGSRLRGNDIESCARPVVYSDPTENPFGGGVLGSNRHQSRMMQR